MTNEERDLITRFVERISGRAATGSVPGAVPPLPPVDPEADALIGELFTRYPEARYRMAQTAFVQEHALVEAQNRIKRLEWELDQANQRAQAAAAQPQAGRGFFGGLFGGGQPQQPPQQQPQQPPPYAAQQGQQQQYAPPPQYAPGFQPGMFQRPGSGFLGSALTTAAGVAGGMVVGNALMDLFSPHRAFAGGTEGFASGGFGGGAAASPWGPAADPAATANPWDSARNDASLDTTAPGPDPSAGWSDAATSDPVFDTSSDLDSGGGDFDNT